MDGWNGREGNDGCVAFAVGTYEFVLWVCVVRRVDREY